jgi:acetyl esterase
VRVRQVEVERPRSEAVQQEDPGAMLDSKVARILADERAALGSAPPGGYSVAEVRRLFELRAARFRGRSASSEILKAREIEVAGLQCRFYFHDRISTNAALFLFFHGGGFVAGSLASHDQLVREICAAAGCAGLSVGYRLAPEYRFPAAVDDGLAVAEWVMRNGSRLGIDPGRILIGGDSAGGNIAAVTAIRMRDAGNAAFAGQVLIYPVTDHFSGGHASYRRFATGFGLTRDSMIWYWRQYLSSATKADNPLVSPLRAPRLTGLPPAIVVVAQCDPLHDEGLAYADRLTGEGVETVVIDCPGMPHGFLRFSGEVEGVQRVIGRIARWMRNRIARERHGSGTAAVAQG